MAGLHITQEDRDNERRIANLWEEERLCIINLTSDPAAVDGIAVRNEMVVAVLEIKQRPKYNSLNMSHFWIDEQKLDEMALIGKGLDVPWILVVQDSNGRILWLKCPLSQHYHKETFTRDREGEKPDIVCHIPSDSWKVLKECKQLQHQNPQQSHSLPWDL